MTMIAQHPCLTNTMRPTHPKPINTGQRRSIVFLYRPRGILGESNLRTFRRVAERYDFQPIIVAERPEIIDEALNLGGAVHFLPSLEDGDAVVNKVRQLTHNHNIAHIIADYERDVETAARCRNEFGIDGGIMADVAERFRDKTVMHAVASAIPDRVFHIPDALPTLQDQAAVMEFAQRYDFHIIVKHRRGSGTRQVHAITSESALALFLREHRSELEDYRAEEFLKSDAPQFHVDTLVHDGKILFEVPSQYSYNPLDYRTAQFPGTISAYFDRSELVQRVRQANQQVIHGLGLEMGVTHAEFFVVGGELVFGEIGARMGGGPIRQMIYELSGVDLAAAWIRMIADPDFQSAPITPQHAHGLHAEVGALILTGSQLPYMPDMSQLPSLFGSGMIYADLLTRRDFTTDEPKFSADGVGYCLFSGDARFQVMQDFARFHQFVDDQRLPPLPRHGQAGKSAGVGA
jgi:biotin carboxylase